MFGELLDRVLTQTPGAVGVTLMGFDGIAIDSREVPGASDIQTTAIELGNVATQLKRISESVGTGDVEEFSVSTGDITTVMRLLTEDYFVALSLNKGANTGKGRFLLRVVGAKLKAELA